MPSSPEPNITGTNQGTGPDHFGVISKIQRYSTRDGPGIRTTVFCAGCNLRCIWCANPELFTGDTQILYYRNRCVRCGACTARSRGTIIIGPEGCEIDRIHCNNLAECAAACNHEAYESSGHSITPVELTRKLLRDKAFYDQSGGGITFSGGEPALQPEFIAETAALLRNAGVHTALDTAGNAEWESLETMAENMDLILFDIKAFDDEIHKNCTGVSNSLILENAERFARWNKVLWIRLIFAPPFNDGTDWEKRLDFVNFLGKAVNRIDLLPLHKLGAGKYCALDMPDPLEGVPECSPEAVAEALRIAECKGLTLII
ncbi:MAG: glycyl-radical enzyme activating protein [Treponema sp.]|jgi:pyruvate formate lyase activating enzyme|nr:glycyl-radical enzyme activating protein [Treponema sp.]